MQIITIDNQQIGAGQPPYIIAEVSANHNGSIERAKATIEAAKQAGANAVKLQTYSPDTMTIESDRPEFQIQGGLWDGYSLYELYIWAQTPFEWHEELFAHAKKIGITIFSTPFDETAVDLLESLGAPAYKVASFEFTDLPLIEYIAKTGKPMILSTGMATEAEIEATLTTIAKTGNQQVILLHCISSYPASIEQAQVLQVQEIANKFKVIAGLSDHTLNSVSAIAATALGAKVIEKHFILDRADGGVDADFSIEPKELQELVTSCNQAWLSLGKPGFHRQPVEEASKQFRRSIYFVKDMKAGETISEQHIKRIRPGLGLEPKHYQQLLGKRAKQDIARATPASWELVE